MAVVIKCGFETIDIDLRNSVLKKGRLLFESGHVLDVEEKKLVSCTDENSHLNLPNECNLGLGLNEIFGQVLPQTSISKTPYRVVLTVNSKRTVVGTYCDCKAGLGQCKHIAALAIAVNEEQPKSCTSEAQVWGRPSARIKNKYKKGIRMEDMFPPKKSAEINHIPIFNMNADGLGAFSIMMCAEQKSETQRICSDVLRDIAEKVEKQVSRENVLEVCETIFERQRELSVFSGHFEDCKFQIEPDIADFYTANVCIDKSSACLLCSNRVQQDDCELWFQERKLRISSTKAHRVKTRKSDYEGLTQQFLCAKTFFSAATQYGIKTEDKARRVYCSLYNVDIVQVGLVVSLRQPFLCCSPDGVVRNGTHLELVEIKCPYTLQNKMLVDWETSTSHVPYLKFDKDELILMPSHQYYTQVQFSLYITRANKCYFFVYSKRQSVRICISRNDEFLNKYVPKVQSYYFSSYLKGLFLLKGK